MGSLVYLLSFSIDFIDNFPDNFKGVVQNKDHQEIG
jgi:hypothetical protein